MDTVMININKDEWDMSNTWTEVKSFIICKNCKENYLTILGSFLRYCKICNEKR